MLVELYPSPVLRPSVEDIEVMELLERIVGLDVGAAVLKLKVVERTVDKLIEELLGNSGVVVDEKPSPFLSPFVDETLEVDTGAAFVELLGTVMELEELFENGVVYGEGEDIE